MTQYMQFVQVPYLGAVHRADAGVDESGYESADGGVELHCTVGVWGSHFLHPHFLLLPRRLISLHGVCLQMGLHHHCQVALLESFLHPGQFLPQHQLLLQPPQHAKVEKDGQGPRLGVVGAQIQTLPVLNLGVDVGAQSLLVGVVEGVLAVHPHHPFLWAVLFHSLVCILRHHVPQCGLLHRVLEDHGDVRGDKTKEWYPDAVAQVGHGQKAQDVPDQKAGVDEQLEKAHGGVHTR